MTMPYQLRHIGLSDYAIHTYLSLLRHHPINGSQLSKRSGIPRARIYDVLRMLKERGFVSESGKGMFVPLPPEELIRQLRRSHEHDLQQLEALIDAVNAPAEHDFIWTLIGHGAVMEKAREMIADAKSEIYVRLSLPEADKLVPTLKQAQNRGVPVKCIFMQPFPRTFAIQVIHPQHEEVQCRLGGRSFDLVVDRSEYIGGIFGEGHNENSRINWGRNRAFVIAGRDSLRHDFFHYFLYKLQTLRQPLDDEEKRLYATILKDM